jgi:hypothetical protein
VSKARIKTVEKEHLSDGGMAIITKLGMGWGFTRTYASLEQPPDCHINITKAQAYELMAQAIINDVLERD